MNGIVDLLAEKVQFLEKFYEMNEKAIVRFSEGNFDDLESFYNGRETILEMIKKLDQLVVKADQLATNESQIDNGTKAAVLKLLNYKNDLVTNILSQDLQILSVIEQAKSAIIKELCQVQAAQKALGAYGMGEKEHRLDESY